MLEHGWKRGISQQRLREGTSGRTVGVLQLSRQLARVQKLQSLPLGPQGRGSTLDGVKEALHLLLVARDGRAAGRARAGGKAAAAGVRVSPWIIGVLQLARELAGVKHHQALVRPGHLDRQQLVVRPEDLRGAAGERQGEDGGLGGGGG